MNKFVLGLIILSASALFITVGLYFSGDIISGFPPDPKSFLAQLFSPAEKPDPAISGREILESGSASSLAVRNKTEKQVSDSLNPMPLLSSAAATCSEASSSSPSREVLINETAWAGTGRDKASHEWIELKNNTGGKITLADWQILNKTASIKVIFDSSDAIEAGGYYLLERGDDETVPGIKADKIYTSALKNSDESIHLFNGKCDLVDKVAANPDWPAGTASPDYRTAERGENFSWHTYSGNGSASSPQVFGTPRAENSLLAQAGSPAKISSSSPPVHYTLQILKSGNGSGAVVSEPAGINCNAACLEDSEDFADGTSVVLSAAPASGSYFWGWAGDCSGTGAKCDLRIDGTKNVTAIFNLVSLPSNGNLPPAPSGGSPRSNANHILISQIQITGGAGQTANDFIEIYNPTAAQFNLKGYRLVKRTQTGTSDTSIKSWTSDTVIPAYGFYLWANSAYASIARTPDAATTASIADNNGIAIRFGPEDTGEIIDAVAWGNFQNFLFESSAFSNPGANQSIIRKTWNGNCLAASLDKAMGNGCDTGNNAQDFEILGNSNPRNSQY